MSTSGSVPTQDTTNQELDHEHDPDHEGTPPENVAGMSPTGQLGDPQHDQPDPEQQRADAHSTILLSSASTLIDVKPSFAQLTHAVTTLAALVIVAILAGDHTIAGNTALAALGIITGTSLGIGANPPGTPTRTNFPGPG